MSNEIIMSDEETIMRETAKLMDLIGSIEEKVRVNDLQLTEVEQTTLEKAKLRLSEIEKDNREEIQQQINDSLDRGEGIFLKEQYREIKEKKEE
ncbi:hypothetical protein ES703_85051 [subsurface metagenome]